MARQSWDETWMQVAEVISHRSICVGRKIGAVIVDSANRPISSGYNGPPRGFDVDEARDCTAFCPRSKMPTSERGASYGDCYTIHAEANAIIFADRRTFEGGTLYVTSVPCWECAKIVANSGIRRVVFNLDLDLDAHRKPDRTILFLDQCGLEFTIWNERA